MTGEETIRVTGVVTIDRSIFGLDEMRRPGEERPFWAELPVDGTPVRVGQGIAMVTSNAQSHDASVVIEVSPTVLTLGPEFELLGEWPWVTGAGEQILCNIDGPVLEFRLRANCRYTLRVWRAGGDTADARFKEMMGVVFPIEGLERYHFVFTPVK
ncbi:Haze protective factor 1 [Streptomyces albipurpureus]|uniref:Haze protective factor 1 n=1 Tax=Streptomyces albipurpureus TaxID=2897419 RepID=A0ABT0UZB6_9ACTN|nr:Haze protective factor 1 [Streptomyces sp. CWNU-1]MCM2393767.1 Haze protective factor 1 [Streptomyces sp. CWNU-1]